jgi:hypothetical protein
MSLLYRVLIAVPTIGESIHFNQAVQPCCTIAEHCQNTVTYPACLPRQRRMISPVPYSPRSLDSGINAFRLHGTAFFRTTSAKQNGSRASGNMFRMYPRGTADLNYLLTYPAAALNVPCSRAYCNIRDLVRTSFSPTL